MFSLVFFLIQVVLLMCEDMQKKKKKGDGASTCTVYVGISDFFFNATVELVILLWEYNG